MKIVYYFLLISDELMFLFCIFVGLINNHNINNL